MSTTPLLDELVKNQLHMRLRNEPEPYTARVGRKLLKPLVAELMTLGVIDGVSPRQMKKAITTGRLEFHNMRITT